MKLIFCKDCQDVYKLSVAEIRKCECGGTWGRYHPEGYLAVYGGKDAVPLGFSNQELGEAIRNQPTKGWGEEFAAFVVAKTECSSFVRVTSKEKIIHAGSVCPKCNDKIFSYHRHDFRGCSCGEMFVDGGFDYLRGSISPPVRLAAKGKRLYYILYKRDPKLNNWVKDHEEDI